MENFIICYIALSVLVGILFTHEHGGDLGDVPINMFKSTLEKIKAERTTKFGAVIIFIGWVIWNLTVLPWTIMGLIFFSGGRLLKRMMFKEEK